MFLGRGFPARPVAAARNAVEEAKERANVKRPGDHKGWKGCKVPMCALLLSEFPLTHFQKRSVLFLVGMVALGFFAVIQFALFLHPPTHSKVQAVWHEILSISGVWRNGLKKMPLFSRDHFYCFVACYFVEL